jgi:predicted permease
MWSWLKRRRLDLDEDDFQDEIRAHLDIAEQERIAGGADQRHARDAAIREFGNVTLTTEAARRVWTPRWLRAARDYASDVRYALRTLAKNPGFAITVIAVLMLGIGLNAAVFTMVKSLALTPIAGVRGSAQQRVIVAETSTGRRLRVSYPEYQYLRDHNQAFSGLMGSVLATVGLGTGRSGQPVWAELVTGNYFQVLGVGAARGRTLLPGDETAAGRDPVAVLGNGSWRRDFGADPAIVGKTIEVNNVPLTVVGVADATFHGTTVVYDVDLFIPITMAPELGFTLGSQEKTAAGVFADRGALFFYPEGYLRADTTEAAAAAQIDALWHTLARERPVADAVERLRVLPFWQTPGGAPSNILPTLMVLSAMGLMVLLIACANIAGLVVVRGVSRRGEIAMRLALGATRARIVRLLIVENLVLALPGAILGVVLAAESLPILVAYVESLIAPQRVFLNLDVDRLVIGFAVVVACGCALVFGFMPALRSARVDLVSVINEVTPRGAARGRFRSGLVVAQVAVSLLLLVGAGLVTRSLDAARRAHPGFDMNQVASVSVDLRQNGYDESRGRTFYRELLARARADAITESATLAAHEPLAFLDTPVRRVVIDGYEPRRNEDMAFMSNVIGSDYFRTLRIDLITGRAFEERDTDTAAPVIIVNRTMAERFWGGAANAIGKRVRVAGDDWRTVIGVAADVKYLRINESPRPYFYVPFLQSRRSAMTLYIRANAPDDVLVDSARAQVTTLDPDLPILGADTLRERIRGSLILFNLTAAMLLVFGLAGMALAAMGTYGLVSYSVKQSTQEIGIRMALGATGLVVVRGFLARGLRLGLIGAALGIATALVVSRLLTSVLYGVSATDVTSFGRALAVVLAGVLLATLIPAARAARTDPLRALRHH